jgi:multiple sugar transport system permease protein
VFVGLGNYTEALKDSQFLSGLGRIALFFVVQVPIMIVLATVFALIIDSGRLRAPKLFRVAFFVPYAVPAVVAALMWGYLYGAKFGPFTQLARDLGTAQPHFLTASHLLPSIANVVTWEFAGYNMIILYAALQAIPTELYEAASMDGAGPWAQIRRITIPMLARTTSLVLVLQVIASLKVFDQMYIMTSGGPNFSTRPVLEYLYDEGFTNFRVGYASSVSTLFFILVLTVSAVWVFLTRRQEQGI